MCVNTLILQWEILLHYLLIVCVCVAQVSSTTGSSVSTPPLPNHSHHPLVPPGMVYPLMTPLLPTTKLSKAPDALKKSTGAFCCVYIKLLLLEVLFRESVWILTQSVDFRVLGVYLPAFSSQYLLVGGWFY